jgi:hypothetical protein
MYFPSRNLPAANDQAALTLQIYEHRIIAWHLSVLMAAFLTVNSGVQTHAVGARRIRRDNKSR